MRTVLHLIAFLLLPALLISCGHKKKKDTHAPKVEKLTATLLPKSNSKTSGHVDFIQEGSNVKMIVNIAGLPANSVHGFHIHEFGDCRAPDATSAGSHFTAHDEPHGAPGAGQHHTGDLGNIQSNAQGKVEKEDTYSHFSLTGRANSIIGRSLVVHEKADDLTSQPTGDAGGRIACGVIGVSE